MPRARNIKPSLFKNEVLGEADPLLTILFTGLWCLADREGRMEDRPKRIKAEIFPYREISDFNGYLTVLEQLGFITRYSVDNCDFIQVENFSKHQSPHKTEKASEIPKKPEQSERCDQSREAPLNNGYETVKESLIPDSGFLIPDSSNTEVGAAKSPKQQLDFSSWPELPDQQILRDWMAARKKAKGSSSQTAINTLGKELHKAVAKGYTVNECAEEAIMKTWRGFKADWMDNAKGGTNGQSYRRIGQDDYNTDGWADGFNPNQDIADYLIHGDGSDHN